MTIKDDVLAAFGKLDAADDSLWNKDGTPKLEAIRNAANDQRISRDELIGSIGDLRRPEQKAKVEEPTEPVQAAPEVDPDAGKEDTVNVTKPAVPGVENVDAPDKRAIIAEAKEALASLDEQAREAAKRKEETDREVASLEQQRQSFLRVIEENEEHLSHADAIKRVQAQTVKNLTANKDRIIAASAALGAAGLKPTSAASPLDAAYAARKKSPEQATNQAQYIAQQQARRLSERLGTV